MTAYARTRQRSTAVYFKPYTNTSYPSGTVSSPAEIFTNFEVCSDAIHSRYPYEGGPFSLRKTEYKPFSTGCKSGSTSINTTYGILSGTVLEGVGVRPPSVPSGIPSDTALKKSLYGYGASAFKRFAPKPHSISLGESFFELKETFKNCYQILHNLRRIRCLSKREPRISELASAYLGYQFGWKPFIQDLIKCITSMKKIDAQIESALRLNNRWVKRSGTILDEYRVLSTKNVTAAVVVPLNYITQLSCKDETTVKDHIWFEGKFKYHIPNMQNASYSDKLKALPVIWDISINPSSVYQMIPWTWLFDWFSNTGDIMYNLNQSMSNNLVAKYAYLMHEATYQTERTALWKSRFIHRINGIGEPQYMYGAGSSSTIVTCKNRIAGNPFGFNLTLPDFSSWQVSILLALGLR